MGCCSNKPIIDTQSPIIKKLNIDQEQIVTKSDEMQLTPHKRNQYIGCINGQIQKYTPPQCYFTIHLNTEKYNNNNKNNIGWDNYDTKDTTWIILYHKTIPSAVNEIILNGFKIGRNQVYKNKDCRFGRGKIGEGVYFSEDIEECLEYGQNLQIDNKEYHIIFMCRVNPLFVKSPIDRQDFYVVEDTNQIRPVQLLFKYDDRN